MKNVAALVVIDLLTLLFVLFLAFDARAESAVVPVEVWYADKYISSCALSQTLRGAERVLGVSFDFVDKTPDSYRIRFKVCCGTPRVRVDRNRGVMTVYVADSLKETVRLTVAGLKKLLRGN